MSFRPIVTALVLVAAALLLSGCFLHTGHTGLGLGAAINGDGTRLAFGYDTGSAWWIVVADPATGAVLDQQRTRDTVDAVAIRPGSEEVFFVQTRPLDDGVESSVWRWTPSTGDLRQVVDWGYPITRLAVAQDASMVLQRAMRAGYGDSIALDYGNNVDLYSYDAQGHERLRLTSIDSYLAFSFGLAPDGTRVVAADKETRSYDPNRSLLIIDVQTGRQSRLNTTAQAASGAGYLAETGTLSPDGKTWYFASSPRGGFPSGIDNSQTRLMAADTASGAVRDVGPFEVRDRFVIDDAATQILTWQWAHEGKSPAYVQHGASGPAEEFVLKA